MSSTQLFIILSIYIVVLVWSIAEPKRETFFSQKKKPLTEWVDLAKEPNRLPVEGTEVLCYVAPYQRYIVAWVNYDQLSRYGTVWRTESECLSEEYFNDLPTHWQLINPPSL